MDFGAVMKVVGNPIGAVGDAISKEGYRNRKDDVETGGLWFIIGLFVFIWFLPLIIALFMAFRCREPALDILAAFKSPILYIIVRLIWPCSRRSPTSSDE